MDTQLKAKEIFKTVWSPQYFFKVVLIALTYFAFGRIGLLFDAVSGFATFVWAPTGISLVILFLGGRKFAPGILLGAFFTNLTIGAEPFTAFLIAFGNMFEAIVGASCLRALKFDPRLSRVSDVLTLAIPVAFISTMISATIGVTALYISSVVTFNTFTDTWLTWWIGDMMGAIVFAPILFVWFDIFSEREKMHYTTEGLLPFSFLIVTNLLVFFGRSSLLDIDSTIYQRFLYPIFIPFIWLAFKVKPRGVVTSLFITSIISIWATVAGRGPFVGKNLSDSLFALQLFIGSISITVLFLSATLAEKEELLLNKNSRSNLR